MRNALLSLTLAVASFAASAVQLVLSPSNVVGSSGAFDPGFNAGNILDQQTGAVADISRSTYWLNVNNSGANQVFITVDLGGPYRIDSLVLFNTHNDFVYDRGTGNFNIIGGNSVTDLGGGNLKVSGPTIPLVSGTLAAVGTVVPPPVTFAVSSSAEVRYLSFIPLSVASTNPAAGPTAYGLNELRVFATAVPEPGTWGLFAAGLGWVGWLARRRQNA